MKRILCLFFAAVCALTAFLILSPGAYALEEPELKECSGVILMHNDSKTVLYEKNADDLLPAGVGMRLLAALTFLDGYGGQTSRTVSVDRRVTGLASSTLVTTAGAPAGLKAGEQIPVYDLLCAMLIANSDDAVYALAFDLYGDETSPVSAAVSAMQQKAESIGAFNTSVTDLLGAPPSSEGERCSMSCAADLAKIALEAQKNAVLRSVCACTRYTVPQTDKTAARLLLTRNSFLSAERVPGFTYKAATGLLCEESAALGSCGIFSAENEGRGYTCVVIGGGERNDAFRIARMLFEWGMKNYSYKKVLDSIEIVKEVKVDLSSEFDYVTVSPSSAISVFLPNDVDLSKEITREVEAVERIDAPVSEGQKLGTIRVYYKNVRIGEADLIANGSLPLSNSGYYFSLFQNFITSPVFITVTVILVLFLILYIFVNARVRWLRRNRPEDMEFDDEDAGAPRAPEGEQYGALVTKSGVENEKQRKARKQPESDPAEKSVSENKRSEKRRQTPASAEKTDPSAAQKTTEESASILTEERTPLEQSADEERRMEEERAREEEQKRLRELEREKAKKRAQKKTFYDLELDEMTPGADDDVPEDGSGASDEAGDGTYEPDGWGGYKS